MTTLRAGEPYVEYDWTAGVYRFRIGDTFTDFRGVRSFASLDEWRGWLTRAGWSLGAKTDTRVWSINTGAPRGWTEEI